MGGFLAMSTPGVGGAPPLPGATVADAAAGGMQAALAITAALAGRATTGRGAYLDVSVAEGVLWLTSLAIDEQLALGGDVLPGHDVLSGRYACYGTYAGSDGKWLAVGAIEAKFFANLCAALGCPELAASQFDDDAQDARSGRRSRPRSPRGHATSGWRSWPGPTPASPRCSRSPRWPAYPQFVARGVVSDGVASDGGRAVAAGAAAGRHGAVRRTGRRWRCPT